MFSFQEPTKNASLKARNYRKAVEINKPQSQKEGPTRTKDDTTRTKFTASTMKGAATRCSQREPSSKPRRMDYQMNGSIPSRAARSVKLTTRGPTTLPTVRIVKHASPVETSRALQGTDSQNVVQRTATECFNGRVRQSLASNSSPASSATNREEKKEKMDRFCLKRDGYDLVYSRTFTGIFTTISLQIKTVLTLKVLFTLQHPLPVSPELMITTYR